MERLTEQMKRAQGVTEQLKAENALEWVQRINNIRACAKEIIEKRNHLCIITERRQRKIFAA